MILFGALIRAVSVDWSVRAITVVRAVRIDGAIRVVRARALYKFSLPKFFVASFALPRMLLVSLVLLVEFLFCLITNHGENRSGWRTSSISGVHSVVFYQTKLEFCEKRAAWEHCAELAMEEPWKRGLNIGGEQDFSH